MPEFTEMRGADVEIPDDVDISVTGVLVLIGRLQRRLTLVEDSFTEQTRKVSELTTNTDRHFADILTRIEEIQRDVTLGNNTQEKVVENLTWIIAQVTTAMTALQKMPGIAGMMRK